MMSEYNPFKSEEEELAYIKKKGLDKYACSKHGLDFDFGCTECHDKWAEYVGTKKLYVVSEFGSTGQDSLLKAEET